MKQKTKKIKLKNSFKRLHKSYLFVLLIGLGLGYSLFAINNDNLGFSFTYVENATENFYIQKPWLPKTLPPMDRIGYSLTYDTRFKNPLWVYEDLTFNNIQGGTERGDYFKEDNAIPSIFRAKLLDYKGSGFDRGHMAPAANHKNSRTEMEDTFYMSNMCPQCPALNRGFWAKLEKYVRDLTRSYSHVYVITGPLYLPNEEDSGKRYIKLEVIGSSNVVVPTHFFKVIRMESQQGTCKNEAYLVPNNPVPSNCSLEDYKTSIEKIEAISGLILSSK